MAAFLRQGARRIGGSVLQRTQAAVTSPAVAEERRRLVPRRMYSAGERPSAQEVQQKKEELYETLSMAGNLRDRALLQDLAVHVNPRPHETQWRRLRVARRISNFIEGTGTTVFVSIVVVVNCLHGVYDTSVKQATMLRENEAKKRDAMERESQVETMMEKQV